MIIGQLKDYKIYSLGGGLGEPHVVQKLGKYTLRTGREMRLTTHIGEYEMDQVILDLG